MRRWKRVETADGPRFLSSFALQEAALLRKLARSVVEMLDERESSAPVDELEEITGIKSGHPQPPDEAALRRLLPDFYRTRAPDADVGGVRGARDAGDVDVGLNSALRSLYEPGIIAAKRQAAQQLLDTVPDRGGRLELTQNQADAWIAAVNDIRLTLGTILGIDANGPRPVPPDHPMAGQLNVYQWLTVVQEYLVLALMEQTS